MRTDEAKLASARLELLSNDISLQRMVDDIEQIYLNA